MFELRNLRTKLLVKLRRPLQQNCSHWRREISWKRSWFVKCANRLFTFIWNWNVSSRKDEILAINDRKRITGPGSSQGYRSKWNISVLYSKCYGKCAKIKFVSNYFPVAKDVGDIFSAKAVCAIKRGGKYLIAYENRVCGRVLKRKEGGRTAQYARCFRTERWK